MAKMMFQFTPPRPDDPSAKMSPQEWIQHQDRRSVLKRQSSFDFDDAKQKKLKLDPRDKNTHTSILDYHTDTQLSYEDREEICATYPIDEFLDETRELREQQQKEIKKIPGLLLQLQTRGTEFKAFKKETDGQIKALEDKDKKKSAQIEALEVKDMKVNAEVNEIKAHFAVLNAHLAANDNVRLTMFVANLLLGAVKKLAKIRGEQFAKGNNDPEHSTTRYQQYAEKLRYDDRGKAAWKKDTGLDPIHLTTVRNLGHYQTQRNDAAHETQHQFASLLLSDRYKNKREYYLYGELFEWVYGTTLEKAAKVEQNLTSFRPDEIEDIERYLKKKLADSAGNEGSGNP